MRSDTEQPGDESSVSSVSATHTVRRSQACFLHEGAIARLSREISLLTGENARGASGFDLRRIRKKNEFARNVRKLCCRGISQVPF